MKKATFCYVLLASILLVTLTSCGFTLRGDTELAEPLKLMYLQTVDPYGPFTKSLDQSLKMSNVTTVSNPKKAHTILQIIRDDTEQKLLSVSGTQQTRQYELKVTVMFQVLNNKGSIIVGPQALAETRTITVQSNQILGSSNEANSYFDQMRRSLASAVMYRLSSVQLTKQINRAFSDKK